MENTNNGGKETNGVFPKKMEDMLLWCGKSGVFTQVKKTCSKLDTSRKDLRKMGYSQVEKTCSKLDTSQKDLRQMGLLLILKKLLFRLIFSLHRVFLQRSNIPKSNREN